MPSSRKTAMTALAAALGASRVFAQADVKVKNPKKSDNEERKEKSGKGDEDALDLPIPKGQAQHGVKVPLYDAEGRLKMRFEIGIGTWVDEENVKMTKLRIETFKEDGTPDLDMDLPDAIYNSRTKNLTSEIEVTVKRADFEITGHSMTYNLTTGAGTLGGGVRMLVYDISGQTGNKPKENKTSIELNPAPKK